MLRFKISLLGLLSWGVAYALPLGNPADPTFYQKGMLFPGWTYNLCDPCFCFIDAWSVRAGYYGDFVYNRYLEIDGTGTGFGHTIRNTKLSTNAGFLALNIGERIDVFGTVGATTFSMTAADISFLVGGRVQSYLNWQTAFSWSVGGRATLLQYNCFSLGVEGQYFHVKPKFKSFTEGFAGGPAYFNENNLFTYKEWQVGATVGYTLSSFYPKFTFTPYGGIKWSDSQFRTNDFQFVIPGNSSPTIIYNMKSEKHWGGAVGMTATFCGMIGATVEGRYGDEKALYVNGSFRF